MSYQSKEFNLRNFSKVPASEALDSKVQSNASSLIRLVVAELPDRGVAPNDIIALIRMDYPNAQIMFVAPQAAVVPVGEGSATAVVSAERGVAEAVLAHGLNATAAPRTPAGPSELGEAEAARQKSLAAAVRKLPPRQAEVAGGLVRGLSNKGIAREMGLSESTVKVYVVSIFRLLDVHSRAAAISTILGSPELRHELGF